MSIFKKIVGKIIPLSQDTPASPDQVKLGDSLKNADLDYRFAQLFTNSGGFFNYCADEAEALHTLNQIIKIENLQNLYCCSPELATFLDVVKVPYTEQLSPQNDAVFITCEYLIAFDGKVMLSYNNIQHNVVSKLPEKIIIMANISQIVMNLNDAMSRIKRTGNIRNLTAISGSESSLDFGNSAKKKLFLLLLED